MSSSAAFMGNSFRVSYQAAKAAILALTRHTATRWGKDGIRCNALAPGPVETEAVGAVTTPMSVEERLRSLRSTRLGRPDDVASVAALLLSSEGEWINGQTIGVDGGLILR